MRTTTTILVAVLMLAAAVQADVFNLGGVRDPATGAWTGLASLETVTVGNPGNAADTRYETPGYGSVAYTYSIGTYEVTAGQYTAFLNAVGKTDTYGLYDTNMWSDGYGCKIQRSGASGSYEYTVASDYANRPVNYVSWGDAARFVNWLQNGQPTGPQNASTTEAGTYALNGATTKAQLMAIAVPSVATRGDWAGGTTTKWLLPSEDEWYKAAYYKGGSANAGYWDYPTRSNTAPGTDMADPSGNNVNCSLTWWPPSISPIDSGKYFTTVVGEFENSASPYGTFDQGGNVWEWNEAVIGSIDSYRGRRGDSFFHTVDYLPASSRSWDSPATVNVDIGFRVVQVPEPGSLALLALGGLALLRQRR